MTKNLKQSTAVIKNRKIAFTEQGDAGAPVVLFSHSILASSMMWEVQMNLVAEAGFRGIAIDTRGHGLSDSTNPPFTIDALAQDTVDLMDSLAIEKAHFVGLSLGGMIGFGLGLHHADRLLSLCICDARSDVPAPFSTQWSQRIELAEKSGCAALADATSERWFGIEFLNKNPSIAKRFKETISQTSLHGYIGCAKAIQQMAYLEDLHRIKTRTTLIVGGNDAPLPEVMKDIHQRIAASTYQLIPNAGHLPNIDQEALFNAALMSHLQGK
jgi:3-oxoadipate enol-lactonase